ncbi:MAG: 6-pyruvoyltetrahydropterin synthase (6-pyruvoyl tetrahydrobiopterin) synthase [Ignavibacteria bacterium]|nr:MAG: 6-pyruvoyltetrahydropterin synthase (6-pyruvoyl tetrahydrobiopterin) synthase [Ignavibacteria bacterium]KAF0161298.1 MAG: 6-pyruvoyltetrahydropterin synthase (6-pyruvoyl tetrahydrobiopterin) synthase [Ignavibacteria bacterium]
MVYVTRREVFSASHRLFNPNLTEEENYSLFGKCSNENGHGHNYVLEITICGEVDSKTGYLMDLKLLKQIIIDNVISKVDHKNLNLDVNFLTGKIPTAENIAISIWEELENKIPNGNLFSVKLKETENNFVEYKGKVS